MSLDTQFINLNPLTLDGLTTISADALNLNVDAGLLQADSNGDIYGSTNISFEPSIQGVTMTNFIRNAITGSTYIDVNKTTGIISVSGNVTSKWALDITANTIYPAVATTGIVAMNHMVVSGNATMNGDLYVASDIGVGTSPLGGAHRLTTKGRIRVKAFDGVDSSGVIETESNGGYINYLYTSDNSKAYYDGNTANLNIQIALSANAGLEVAGSSVHNAGIYVLGGSEINGTLLVDDTFRVLNSATFTTNYAEIAGEIRGNSGLFITGYASVPNKIYRGGLSVSGASRFESGGLTVTGGNLTTLNVNSLGDITLGRNNSATVGRLITISFGTGNAGSQAQGLVFQDLTTVGNNLGVFGSQNTMRFYAGGTEKMSIGANVDFATAPYVGGDQINTSDVLEVGNLYFTTTRARQSISASSPLSYDNSTGVISLPSSIILKQWSRRVNNFSNASITYYKLGLLSTNSDGDGSFNLRGTLGGWEANTQASFEFSISTRSSRLVWGSLNSSSFSVANLIGRMDFLLYQNASSIFELYMVLKNNTYQAFDFTVQYCDNGNYFAFNPTTTPDPAPSGGSDAITSILGSLNTYTIAGNVAMGWSGANTNKLLVSGNASVQGLFVRSSSVASLGTDLYLNSGGASESIWIRPNGNGSGVGQSLFQPTQTSLQGGAVVIDSASRLGCGMTNPITRIEAINDIGTRSGTNQGLIRLLSFDNVNYIQSGLTYTIGSAAPLVFSNMYYGSEWARFDNTGRFGIGTSTPAFKLDVQQATDTTIRIKSNSTTGDAQLFLQNDNALAGAGLIMYGSFSLTDANKRNGIELANEIGGVFISSSGNMVVNVDTASQTNFSSKLALSGNMNIGRGDNTAFDSALVVAGPDYRTLAGVAGVHMGYSANGFGASLGLIGTATGNCQIEFGARNDLGVADGYIRWNNSSDTMALGADVITFNTNVTVPHTERARFLADGRFIINSNTAISSYAGNVLQTKGRICIGQYDSSDFNPVIEMIDSGGNSRYFYHSGTSGFYMTSRLGLSINPVYQLQLSTDSAGKPTSNGWTIVSDRRLKENIEDANLDMCYENMKRLKLKRFKYKDDWMCDSDGNRKSQDTHFLGFIAQEVKEVFPKAITVIDDSENTGIEDLHTLDTDQLLKSSYGAVQKLMQKVENLEESMIKERIQYKAMKQKQDALITKQGILIESMRKALLMRGISI